MYKGYGELDLGISLKDGEKAFYDRSRSRARSIFQQILNNKKARKKVLEKCLEERGLQLGCQQQALTMLNQWYLEAVDSGVDEAGELTTTSYSIGLDVGLHLGDCIRSRAPNIRWDLCDGPPDGVDYQMPVLRGFSKASYEYFVVSPIRQVWALGRRRIIRKSKGKEHDFGKGRFLKIVESALKWA